MSVELITQERVVLDIVQNYFSSTAASKYGIKISESKKCKASDPSSLVIRWLF